MITRQHKEAPLNGFTTNLHDQQETLNALPAPTFNLTANQSPALQAKAATPPSSGNDTPFQLMQEEEEEANCSQCKADPIQREEGTATPPSGGGSTPPANTGTPPTGGTSAGNNGPTLPPIPNFQLTPPSLLGGPGAGNQPGSMLGIPPLTLGNTPGAPGTTGAPNLQLPPNFIPDNTNTPNPMGPQMSQEQQQAYQDWMLEQQLRSRLPFFGGMLPREWIFSMWQIAPGSQYQFDNGESGNWYDILSDEQLEEQANIARIMNQDYPTPEGWRGGLNNYGLGGAYRFQQGNEFSFGLMPFSGDDERDPRDRTTPETENLGTGATLGVGLTF